MKIAGVPEHFNLPFKLCIENKNFDEAGVSVEWTDVPEGTGKLCQMLRSGETDMAVILTEGIVKDILNGNPSKIIQVYVKSPLLWGIHVGAQSSFDKIEDLKGKKVAISRFGSGSELMAYVNANNLNWPKESISFEVIHTLDGAVKALTDNQADYFMWERFMTQPIVDQGIFRRLGVCPTPWPSFVIAVRDEVWENQQNDVLKVLKTINEMTSAFKEIESVDKIIATRFDQKIENVRQWLQLTEWSTHNFTEKEIDHLQDQLIQFGIIEKKGTFTQLIQG